MWTQKPTAPKLQDIYGNEDGCDVIFLVGQQNCELSSWRIPAHKAILQNSTPVFRAMFSEHFINEDPDKPLIIEVPDVDGRAFDNLVRFLYNEQVQLQSVESSLQTLYAAHKYECLGLLHQCVEYLNGQISVRSVLSILSTIPLFCGNYVQNLENWSRELLMMASTNKEINGVRAADNSMETECAFLLQNCLQFIDNEATAVLNLDEMEDLDQETFGLILSRDSLQLSDENLVFSTVLKWTDKQCKRQHAQLTPESKRKVVGDSLFLPRYLTMPLHCFKSGPAQSGLFTQDEIQFLIKIINNGLSDSSPVNQPIPSTIRPYYRNLARKRVVLVNASPINKKKSFIQKLLSKRCCQCRHSLSPTSSPVRRLNSSPTTQQQPTKWNVAVERIVIFLACLFD